MIFLLNKSIYNLDDISLSPTYRTPKRERSSLFGAILIGSIASFFSLSFYPFRC